MFSLNANDMIIPLNLKYHCIEVCLSLNIYIYIISIQLTNLILFTFNLKLLRLLYVNFFL